MINLKFGLIRIQLIDLFGGTTILKTLKKYHAEALLPINELNHIRDSRLNELFNLAKLTTQYYKNATHYTSLEVLEKPVIKKMYKNFISSTFKGKFHSKSTGGSTGVPLNYLSTPDSRSAMWAGILMSWEVAGYQWGDKVAFIAGTSLAKSNFKHKLFYLLFNIDVYTVYDLSDVRIQEYLHKIKASKVTIIYGYASALGHIANYMLRNKSIEFPHLKGVVCTAEVLTDNIRHAIQTAFFVPVYNQYGCNEAGISAFECQYHKMHLISSRSYYETDHVGNLISTDLSNKGFILMKYKTGDQVEIDESSNCACQSNFPIIKNIMGRTCDIVTDYEGNSIHSCFFNILFRDDRSIKQFQIVFNKQDLKIYLNVDDDRAHTVHYEKYITEIKKYLHFDTYTIVLNAPFLRHENAKHRYIINETKN
jgi:phenylacetate-CoA ligase